MRPYGRPYGRPYCHGVLPVSEIPELDRSEIDRLNSQCLSLLMADRKEAKRINDITLAAAQAIGYGRGLAYAQINQLSLMHYAGESDQAEQICQPLIERFYALGDMEGQMATHVCMGSLTSRRADFAQSKHHFDLARKLASRLPDSLFKFSLYNRIGIDAINRGDNHIAPRNFLLALDMAERFGTPSHRVNALSNLASCQHDLGNDEDAVPLLQEALEAIEQYNVVHFKSLVSANLAMCLLATGKAEEALTILQPLFDCVDAELGEKAFIYCLAAHASIMLAQHDSAHTWLVLAEQFAKESEDYEEQMHAALVHGMLASSRSQFKEALDAFEQANALLSFTRNPFYQQQILKGLSHSNAHFGNWEVAYEFLQQYQTQFEARSKSARDSRVMMRNLEKEMKNLKEERDKALELQAAREVENMKLASLNKELSHQIHHVNSLQKALKEQAIRDHLTGLYNRRHFETCLNAILHESSGKSIVTVVILDLDFFKRVNDTWGHAFGDEVLIQFSRLVESQLRTSDMLCRYGGEEFCLLMRDADSRIAQAKMLAIAEKYRSLTISQGATSITDCTFSAGIAEYPLHGDTRHELLMHADTALYVAKMAGRNQSKIAQ
jgi:diguanylate cyclase (GGDEF)-like protein